MGLPRVRQGEETASQRVLWGGIWNAASQLLPMVVTTALSVVAARVLGADDLGRQSLISFAEGACTSLFVNSITEATIRTISAQLGGGDVIGAARVRRWSMLAHCVSGVGVGVVLVGVGLTQPEDRVSWFIVAGSVVLNALGWAVSAQVVPERGWRPIAIRRLVTQLVGPALGIVAVLAGFGIAGIFAANVLAAAGLLWSLAPLRPPSRRVPWAPVPRQLISLWAGFAAFEVVTQVVTKRIEFAFLAAYSTATEVAMYSIPFMVVSAAAVAPLAVAAASMPIVAMAIGAGDVPRAVERFSWALRMSALISLPLAAALAGAGPVLVELVYGADFARAARLVPLAALVIVLAPAGQLCISYWVGVGRLPPLLWTGGAGAAIDLAAAFLLIPRYGATGAVLANLAGQLATSGMLLTVTVRSLGRVDLRLDRWAVAAAASSVAFVAFAATQALVPGLAGAVASALVGVGCFMAVAVPIGIIRPDDAQQLTAALPAGLHPVVRVVTCR
ncbi:MAG: oligosaccharide flippase family protein [Acidimicrobiia bacterium]|nr:oligosaccharide flippase family protein [Acidimicrobiia bacterium]